MRQFGRDGKLIQPAGDLQSAAEIRRTQLRPNPNASRRDPSPAQEKPLTQADFALRGPSTTAPRLGTTSDPVLAEAAIAAAVSCSLEMDAKEKEKKRAKAKSSNERREPRVKKGSRNAEAKTSIVGKRVGGADRFAALDSSDDYFNTEDGDVALTGW